MTAAAGIPMINNFQDFQKLGQNNVDTALKFFGDWNKGWQAIAAELTDYQKRAFEDGTATFEKLAGAKSLEQAFEIQSSFAKRAYEDYVQQLTKIGSMYTALAKDAYKPVEKAFQGR
ncbi:phasin family protein [Hyphomicrobium sp. CS1GBMeth3]|uniref:phasin family protein n=1 Tax=Hyphomicrobium sp. CS1GBMeth3 TaxID=1892845 RepID=UPI0032AE9374